LPDISERSQTVCEDRIADERLRYYFVINNLFGLIHAFGASGLIDERSLLSLLRERLDGLSQSLPEASDFIREVTSASRLRCKANLLTRFEDLDELIGPLESQSVYVTIENPLFIERWHDQESPLASV
jgi:siderophore synthetase component